MTSSNRRSPAGRTLSPVTARIQDLAVGEELRIEFGDEEPDSVRNRVTGNIRTVRLATGRKFSTYTYHGGYYVQRIED